jgi:hypothetical protein
MLFKNDLRMKQTLQLDFQWNSLIHYCNTMDEANHASDLQVIVLRLANLHSIADAPTASIA